MGYYLRGIVVLCDVGPDTVRRPGAMALDVLQGDTGVEGQGGT